MATQVGYKKQKTSPPKCKCKNFKHEKKQTPYYFESSTDRTQLDSSSSDSTTSEQFPVRLKFNVKAPESTTTHRSHRDDKSTSPCKHFQPKSRPQYNVVITAPVLKRSRIEDSYHSCQSDSSGDETQLNRTKTMRSKTPTVKKNMKNDRDCEVLKLLQRVIELIQEGRKTSSSSSDIPIITPCSRLQDSKPPTNSSSSSNKCQKSSEEAYETKDALGILRTLLNELKEGMQSCGPCKDLRNLLNSSSSKTEECLSVSEDVSTTPSKKSAADDVPPTLSSSTVETECTCMEESVEQKEPEIRPEPTVVHPCPFFSYCMALLNSQGQTLPMFETFSPGTMPIPTEIQKPQEEEYIEPYIETKAQKQEEESLHDDEDIRQETEDEGSYMAEDIAAPLEERDPQLLDTNDYIGYDDFNPQRLSTEKEEIEFGMSKNDYRTDNLNLNTFETQDYELETENREEESCRIDCVMPIEEINNENGEEAANLALYHMERLGSLLNDDMCLEPPNRLCLNEEEEEERPDYILDGFYEEYDDRSELAKEKLAECLKTKEPCDSYDIQESDKKLSKQKAGNDEGLNEFKFFIDSVILDLDAMEHARRKCDVIRNVCMPRSDACCRDSFPVTIIDVQDLGCTSLYVRWKIHDCFGIGGYEIYVDGYLTNRYYHSRHEASVITDVDVTIPHKIALVAQPMLKDDSLMMLCCPNKSKSKSNSHLKDHLYSSPASQWTPSIYLYDPTDNKKTPSFPPIKCD